MPAPSEGIVPTPYYQDDLVTLYHGDSLDLLPRLDLQVDATVTDPPFAVRADRWDQFADDLDFLRFTTLWMREAAKAGGVQVVFFASSWLHVLRDAARYAGVPHRRTLIWHKPPGSQYAGASKDGIWFDFEPVEVFGEPTFETPRSATRFAVMSHRTVVGQGHGCEKPGTLMQVLIDAYTPPKGLVLDPFAGSGTTLRAAKDIGRRAVGIEQSEAHCESIAKRLSQEVIDFGGVA